MRSRDSDVQTARNDALLTVAEAYFNVQQARGRLAGAQDAVDKGPALVAHGRGAGARAWRRPSRRTGRAPAGRAGAGRGGGPRAMAGGQRRPDAGPAAEPRRGRRAAGAAASAGDARSPRTSRWIVSSPSACTSRPELASQQALVQATLARLRQERMRPLVPSLVLRGDATPAAPGGYLMGGVFGSDINGHRQPLGGPQRRERPAPVGAAQPGLRQRGPGPRAPGRAASRP